MSPLLFIFVVPSNLSVPVGVHRARRCRKVAPTLRGPPMENEPASAALRSHLHDRQPPGQHWERSWPGRGRARTSTLEAACSKYVRRYRVIAIIAGEGSPGVEASRASGLMRLAKASP